MNKKGNRIDKNRKNNKNRGLLISGISAVLIGIMILIGFGIKGIYGIVDRKQETAEIASLSNATLGNGGENKDEANVKPEDDELNRIKEIFKNDNNNYLELVNKDHAIENVNIKNELVIPNVPTASKGNIEKNHLRKVAADALENMCAAAKKDGVTIYLCSGYRSIERQVGLYKREIKKLGEEGKNLVAHPGHSEHQTGLAADLTSKSAGFELEETFENTKEGKWLLNNSYKYGFILRYPKDGKERTGYNYEPWHYRYVDKEVSEYMHRNNLTLEELYKKINESYKNN